MIVLIIYFEKIAYRKLKSLIIKPWIFRDGLRTVHPRQRSLYGSHLVETVNYCHKELHARHCSSPRSTSVICF